MLESQAHGRGRGRQDPAANHSQHGTNEGPAGWSSSVAGTWEREDGPRAWTDVGAS